MDTNCKNVCFHRYFCQMETNPTYEAQIAALQAALLEAENKGRMYAQEIEKLRQQYADDVFAERQLGKRLHEERHQLQLDYERLRVQKGGFGLKAMTLSGFAGFCSGLVLCVLYLLLRPKDDHIATFIQFRDANQFRYELAISEGRFDEVEKGLLQNQRLPENKLIQPEIEFARKMVGAARRRCEGR
jgi:hypothetical protein